MALYEVARAAGVGQGTLYRHFADRTALVAAVFEEEVDALELRASNDPGPDVLLTLLGAITASQARLHGLSEALLAVGGAGPELRHLAMRTERLLRAPLEAAIAGGRVRQDLVLEDVVAVLSMMEGMLIGLQSVEARSAAVERGMRIVLHGLGPAGAASATGARPPTVLAPDERS